MAVPDNVLQNVRTYQKAEMARMQNECVHIDLANKKFQNFNDMTAQLGDAVTFDLAPRTVNYSGLGPVTLQPYNQRKHTLACTQTLNNSAAFSEQQFIFNVHDYMDRFGRSAIDELGSDVDSDIAENWVTGVNVNDPDHPSFGTRQTDSGPFRFFGDGATGITSFQQLDQCIRNFKDYGSAKYDYKMVLPSTYISAIVGSGLNQFAQDRNNELASKWRLGRVGDVEVYESNQMPIHIAGSIGDAGTVAGTQLTVVSVTNVGSGNQSYTQIVCTTDASVGADADAVKIGDMFQVMDTVGFTKLRFLKFVGHKPSAQRVQFVAIEDAASVGNSVTLKIRTTNEVGLNWTAGDANQNIPSPLIAGMKIQAYPSHQAGGLMSGDPLYVAMPKRMTFEPYPSVVETDPTSGMSIAHYWGFINGQNKKTYVRTALWGSTMIPENSMRMLFPLI